jgi:hypothetical protein
METTELINIIKHPKSSRRTRLAAIRLLGAALEQRRPAPVGPALHLGHDDQEDLKRIIWLQDKDLDVRCLMAATVAKTANAAVLDWCNEMLGQYL